MKKDKLNIILHELSKIAKNGPVTKEVFNEVVKKHSSNAEERQEITKKFKELCKGKNGESNLCTHKKNEEKDEELFFPEKDEKTNKAFKALEKVFMKDPIAITKMKIYEIAKQEGVPEKDLKELYINNMSYLAKKRSNTPKC